MQGNSFKFIALAATLVLLGVGMYVYRPIHERTTRVSVVGDSQTKVAPDTAVITFSVVTQGRQALDAQQENARKSEAVKQAVDTLLAGSKSEVKTADYSLDPQNDYDSPGVPKIKGYNVRNTVVATIDKLDQVGAVIDAATKAGANSVDGIRFAIGEASPAQGEALSTATKQAMAKAESIAKSMNGHIVRVIEATEGGVPVRADLEPNAYSVSNMSNMKSSIPTPIQAGSLNIRSQVVLVVEIGF